MTMTDTDTLIDIDPRLDEPDLDGEIVTHIVGPQNGVAGAERVMQARVMGTEVEALCGYRWIPSRDPERHPICQACAAVLSTLP